MEPLNITRKDFLKNSTFGVAGLSLIPILTNAQSVIEGSIITPKNYILKNVRLETGFEYENDEVIATKTELFSVEIENGKIKQIDKDLNHKNVIDSKGMLMLPSFKDMHIHMDKTYYDGKKWQAVRKRRGGVKGMIALEQQIMPGLLENATYKAEKMIELLQSHGSSFARSHVNIESTSKLKSLEHLQVALKNKKESFGAELVAFPQHGVFYTDSAAYLKEAAKTDIDFIGGLDPYSIDGTIERTMDFTVQLALDNRKGIDIHLHETGESGLKTVEYLINKVNENPELKGKTYLSHCFVLGKLDKAKQEEIAEELANAQIGVISTIPFGGLIMPIPTLTEKGVKVMTGNDSIVDHWNTFGTGSVLYKTNLAAQLYGKVTEFDLSRMLKLATAGTTPLDDQGKRQWPNTGDDANVILVDASCSAEMVSRMSPVRSLIYKGNIVF